MSDLCTVLIRVRFAECDAQRVVFNARYADYVDLAMTEFMRYTLGDINVLTRRGLDNQAVNMTTNWKSSAAFDDVLAVTVETLRIGTTSFCLRYVMRDYPSGTLRATTDMVYVMVDSREYKKQPIPDDVRAQLLAGAPNIVVNFSGADYDASRMPPLQI